MKYIELKQAFDVTKEGTYEKPINGKILSLGNSLTIVIYPAWSKENMNKCWKLEVYRNGEFDHEFRTPNKDVMEWYLESNIKYMMED